MDISEPPGSGRVVALPSGSIAVGCGDTALELVEVQPEGKPRRAASEWFNGVRTRDPILR